MGSNLCSTPYQPHTFVQVIWCLWALFTSLVKHTSIKGFFVSTQGVNCMCLAQNTYTMSVPFFSCLWLVIICMLLSQRMNVSCFGSLRKNPALKIRKNVHWFFLQVILDSINNTFSGIIYEITCITCIWAVFPTKHQCTLKKAIFTYTISLFYPW